MVMSVSHTFCTISPAAAPVVSAGSIESVLSHCAHVCVPPFFGVRTACVAPGDDVAVPLGVVAGAHAAAMAAALAHALRRRNSRLLSAKRSFSFTRATSTYSLVICDRSSFISSRVSSARGRSRAASAKRIVSRTTIQIAAVCMEPLPPCRAVSAALYCPCSASPSVSVSRTTGTRRFRACARVDRASAFARSNTSATSAARAEGGGVAADPPQAQREVLGELAVRAEAEHDDALRVGQEIDRPAEVVGADRAPRFLDELRVRREAVLEDRDRVVAQLLEAAAEAQRGGRARAERVTQLLLQLREAVVSEDRKSVV